MVHQNAPQITDNIDNNRIEYVDYNDRRQEKHQDVIQ